MASLLGSNLIVATGTALSRITGYARVFALAFVFGQSPIADAYTTANNSPNAIYELLIGGVLSASLVPLFTKLFEDDDTDGRNAVITVGTVIFAFVTAVSVLLAPLIFRLFSLIPADSVDADLFRDVGTSLARLFLIQIFFYGITALGSAVLNAQGRFFAAAWSPVASNVVIVGAFFALPHAPDGGWELADVLTDRRLQLTLGLGATIGIATMAVLIAFAAARTGIGLRWNWDPKNPAVKTLIALSGWTLGYVVANQIALLVVQNLTEPGGGGRTAYSQAYTLFVLPHGLLAVSIATTFVPGMSQAVTRRDRDDFNRRTSLGIRLVALLTFPAGLGILALQRSIVGALLEYGEMTPDEADLTARTLGAFGVGLVGFSVYLFTLRGFYAHLDTRTPFVINAVECALNIGLAFAFVGRFGVPGLAFSFAVAYLLCSTWALTVLRDKARGFPLRDVVGSIVRIGLASVLMAEAVWVVSRFVGADTGSGAIVRFGVGVGVGLVVYVGLLALQGAPELTELRRDLRARVTEPSRAHDPSGPIEAADGSG